jgi:hypothetical protein
MIDKLAQRVRALVSLMTSIDTKGGHGLPESAPAGSKHARPHCVARGQERQHLLEELVWEGANAVLVARQSRFLVSFAFGAPSHSVEQVGRAEAAKLHRCWRRIQTERNQAENEDKIQYSKVGELGGGKQFPRSNKYAACNWSDSKSN